MQVELGEIGAKRSSICDFWRFVSVGGKRNGPPEGRAVGQGGRQPPELGSTWVTTTVVRGWGRSARLLVIDVFT